MHGNCWTWILSLLLTAGLPLAPEPGSGWALAVASAQEEPAPGEPTDALAEDEDDDNEDDDDKLPSFYATTTVTATGSEADTFEIATPVTVISAEEIERKPVENASDLLRDQPGVDVNGVGPNQSRPIIRGQRGLRVLFLENGLRMNNARRQTDFGEIPGLVDLGAVETVEVVRGPASVLYGSDAVGGVLNLITKLPPYGDGFGGALSLRWASAADQFQTRAAVEGRNQGFAYRLSGSWRDGDDYEAAAGSFGNVVLAEETPVVDTGLEDTSFTAYLGYDLTNSQEIFWRYNRYRAEETGFGFVEPALLGEGDAFRIRILYPFQDFDRFTFGYIGSALESVLADTVEVQAYYQQNERNLANDIDINIGPIFPGAPDSSVEADTLNFTDLETFGLRTEVVKVLGGDRHVVTYGLEYFRDDSFNTDFSTTTTTIRFPFPPFELVDVATDAVPNAPNATNASYGVFVQDEIDVAERLKVTLGLRFQDVNTEAEPTPGWDVAGLDFSDSAVVGSANFIYALRDYLKLVGSYGTAFRAPNIVERLFNGVTPEGAGFQILNPDLKSEESDNIDLGIKYRRWDAYFELLFFRNDIEDGIVQFFLDAEDIAQLPPETQDEIAELPEGTFVVQQRNVEKLRAEGIELAAGYRFRDMLDFGVNYTHLDVTRIDSDNPPTGDAISDKLNFYVRYNPPERRFWLEYRLRANGDEPSRIDPGDPLPPVGERIPSFTIHTLSGGVRVWERGRQAHDLMLVADNLTDELYAEFSNATFFRPQPKRNFLATYRVRF